MESKQVRGGGHQKKLNQFNHKTISLSENYWTEKQISDRENFYYSIFNDILFNGEKKNYITP